MKKITTKFFFITLAIASLNSCADKKSQKDTVENIDAINPKSLDEVASTEESKIAMSSYEFAEKLKNDNFFESENKGKTMELKNVGISFYLISGNEVTLYGVFYDKEKNMAIPTDHNKPPGRAFTPTYFDKTEMKYDDKYKLDYTASLSLILKNPKDVKKLKMYLEGTDNRSYEYKLNDGIEPEYRSGFIDLVNITGTFVGQNSASSSFSKIYEFENVEIN